MRTERLRSPDRTAIREVPAASVGFALRDGWQRLPQVHVRLADGRHVVLDEDLAEDAVVKGAWRMTNEEVQAAAAIAHEERRAHVDTGQRWKIAAWSGAGLAVAGAGQLLPRGDAGDLLLLVGIGLASAGVVLLAIHNSKRR